MSEQPGTRLVTMGDSSIQQVQSLQTRQELKLFARMEQANLLEMPEEDFYKLVAELENSSLFQRLYRKDKIIRYQRYPRTDISSSLYQLKEEAVADYGELDVESLLLNKEHVIRQIQKLGLEKFKRYFLYPEADMSVEDIARDCDMEVSQVQKINSLIDELVVLGEFYHPSALGPERGIRYTRVASIERGTEGFVIGYLSPSLARGRYAIDYERFEGLRRGGILSDREAKEAHQLFKKLELLNTRKDTVTQILHKILEKQALYFQSGDLKALLPLGQKELAKRIGLAPSTISRAIGGRSLTTPWGEEKPLKDFFPRPRRFKKELLRQLLETKKELPSDEAIRIRLQEQYGICLSRRSVADLRKELKVAPAWQRKRALLFEATKERQ